MAIFGVNNFTRFLVILAALLIARANTADSNETILSLLQQNPNLGYTFISQLNNLTNSESLAGFDGQARSDTQCILHLRALQKGLQNNKFWAIKMVDAWGKLPSGILAGHLTELGNFDECVGISQPVTLSRSNLVGKYCLAKVPTGESTAIPSFVNLKIGICLPAACSTEHIDFVLKQLFKNLLNLNTAEGKNLVTEKSCTVLAKEPFKALDWVTVGILSCLACLMTLSTFYDYMATHLNKSTPLNPLLAAFSVRSNMRTLFRTQKYKNAPHIIPCLHGIRCLSLVWVVLGHGYGTFTSLPLVNTFNIMNWFRAPFSMFLLTAIISVDSFFFLSGLLVSLLALREMDRNKGRLNVLMMYVHRYLRLTPVVAIAIIVNMTLVRYVTNGPIWNASSSAADVCNETWWATLLYVQNYVYPLKICMPHTWYLAIDFQLYILSPLALYAVWYWKKKGLAVFTVVGLLLFACQFAVIMVNEFTYFGLMGSEDGIKKSYFPTHTRTSPWFVGFIFGYFLHSNTGKRFKLSKLWVLIGWLFALSVVFTVIFSLYPKTQTGAEPMTPLGSAFYLTLSRVTWPLALCWIIFACMNGYGGPANSFLSWTFWQPMSKLSYCLYIWHIMVQTINAGRTKSDKYFSDYDAFLAFWGDFGMTLFVAIVMYLSVEAPFCTVENYFFKSKPKPKIDLVKHVPEPEPEAVPSTTNSKEQLCP